MYCKKCSSKTNEHSGFCADCDPKIQLADAKGIKDTCVSKAGKNSTAIIVIVLVAVLIVGVLAAFLVFPKLMGDKEKTKEPSKETVDNSSSSNKPSGEQNFKITSTFVYDDGTGKTVHFNVPSTLKEEEGYSDFDRKAFIKEFDDDEVSVAEIYIEDCSVTEIFSDVDDSVEDLEKLYEDVIVSEVMEKTVNNNIFKYKKVISKSGKRQLEDLYIAYEIDKDSTLVLQIWYDYISDAELEELLTITIGHIDNVNADKAPVGSTTYLFNETTGEKVYIKLPESLKIDNDFDHYDEKYVVKNIDGDSEIVADITIEERSVTKYLESTKEVVNEHYVEKNGYKNVELSEIQTKVVNGRTYKYIDVKYNYYLDYHYRYLVTELGNDTIYIVELENVDALTESEITALLTIDVVK